MKNRLERAACEMWVFDAMVEEAIYDEGGSSSTADVNDDKDDKIITPCA